MLHDGGSGGGDDDITSLQYSCVDPLIAYLDQVGWSVGGWFVGWLVVFLFFLFHSYDYSHRKTHLKCVHTEHVSP